MISKIYCMNKFLFQVREIGVATDPDAVHDVIDSLFRLGRNASDYSPLKLLSSELSAVHCLGKWKKIY